MGVFKKLTGGDIRVTPIQVKTTKPNVGIVLEGECLIVNIEGAYSSRLDFQNGVGIYNKALLYNSIRQLFYGAFIDNKFLLNGSIFSNFYEGEVTTFPNGTFSRFDPSFQGSLPYQRDLPVDYEEDISVLSLSKNDYGESLVPGTIVMGNLTDDSSGNLIDSNGDVKGNVFYDQGILVRTDGNAVTRINATGSYTVYATQYKCTAGPNEFNASLNPSILSGSSTQYNLRVIDSPEFMPYVTTIGLYNENQELMMVAKLAQPVKLNPYTDTNFIIRIDK